MRITGGERNEITQGEALINKWQEEDTKVSGDKGCDAHKLLEKIGKSKAVIPYKKNRKIRRNYNKHLSKERHLIACFFPKLKQYRHIFSRFDQLAGNFLSFLCFVCLFIITILLQLVARLPKGMDAIPTDRRSQFSVVHSRQALSYMFVICAQCFIHHLLLMLLPKKAKPPT